ncbi:MAG: type II 3-dehydroquinate dehydratase [Bacteroidales bacterium]|jgi:3-dehydroquinate dehydratase-2|nr:type II 3-dehydroquinate dehydratase [Bacteroidales bacterium]
MKVLIINGPNLNLLGVREPGVYGEMTFEEFLEILVKALPEMQIDYFQSNVEGEIINQLHNAMTIYDGVVLNAGGYTHTSVSIADAIRAVSVPVVEVHVSNIFAREDFRKISLTAPNCVGCITGFGLKGYSLAISALAMNLAE